MKKDANPILDLLFITVSTDFLEKKKEKGYMVWLKVQESFILGLPLDQKLAIQDIIFLTQQMIETRGHGPNALLLIDMSTLHNIWTAFSGVWILLAVAGCDLRHMVANGSNC